jgi:IS30 family transposase
MRLTAYFCLSTMLRAVNGNPRQLDENDKLIIAYLKQAGCNSDEIAYATARSKGAIITHLKEIEKE